MKNKLRNNLAGLSNLQGLRPVQLDRNRGARVHPQAQGGLQADTWRSDSEQKTLFWSCINIFYNKFAVSLSGRPRASATNRFLKVANLDQNVEFLLAYNHQHARQSFLFIIWFCLVL